MKHQEQRGTSPSSRLFGTLFALAARTSTGLTGYVESLLVDSLSTYMLAGCESMLGGIVLLAIWQIGRILRHRHTERTLALGKEFIGVVAGLAVLSVLTKELALLALSAKFPSGSLGACLALGPLSLAAFKGIREGQPRRAITTSVMAFAGVALVTGALSSKGVSIPLIGAIYALTAAASRTITIPLSRRTLDRGQAAAANAVSTLLSGALLLGWSAFVAHDDFARLENSGLAAAIGAVSIISTVLPQALDTIARRRISDRTYSVIYASGPVISTLLSLFGHQQMTVLQITGVAVISTAVLISRLGPRKQ